MAATLPLERAPGAPELLELARRRFLRGERLAIEGLAAELGVSRATAYRWAGGNVDALTGRVIAVLAADTFARCLREARGRGWERIVDVQARGMRYISSYGPYRTFLERERDKALRIVASREGSAQETMIRLNQELLEEEARRGRIRLSVDAHTLAYAIVRIAESFLYADLITGEDPDIDKAVSVMRLLLR